ncbi:SH3 domain-containing protein [Altererythrobacter sp. ZODW24]|uniref:SH3 domain-containing protein n=1 Tax=Altererythrobacter sp. ZODW24 TaxID=2185142 RepID=UPI000DF7BEE4|nr:SH3 domain-containing protein [Altererythrobacter sp. ZODW24]
MKTIARLAAVTLLALSVPASAQNREVPYWASMRATEVNMRVGPSADYKIDWVYKRQGLPIRVIRRMEGWRLIQDPDGTQGWVVARLLTPERAAIVIGDEPTEMREGAGEGTPLKWKLAPGVVGKLGDCKKDWCEFNVKGRAGWVKADKLWGDGEP